MNGYCIVCGYISHLNGIMDLTAAWKWYQWENVTKCKIYWWTMVTYCLLIIIDSYFKYPGQIYSCLNKVIFLSKEWERKKTKC